MKYEGAPEYRPLSPWSYFFLSILYEIPLIGLIFLIVHALSDANINRRNFARSFFCALILVLIVIIVLFATGLGFAAFDAIRSAISG